MTVWICCGDSQVSAIPYVEKGRRVINAGAPNVRFRVRPTTQSARHDPGYPQPAHPVVRSVAAHIRKAHTVATELPSALWEALNTRATMVTARGSVVVRAWASGGQTGVGHSRYFRYRSDISDRGIQVILARAGAEHSGWGKRVDRFQYIASGNERLI